MNPCEQLVVRITKLSDSGCSHPFVWGIYLPGSNTCDKAGEAPSLFNAMDQARDAAVREIFGKKEAEPQD